LSCKHKTQEAQLSQRDRAMLRVTEYFDKSLSALFIRNDSLEYGVYKSLLVFHCNYLVSWSYHFWDIQRPI